MEQNYITLCIKRPAEAYLLHDSYEFMKACGQFYPHDAMLEQCVTVAIVPVLRNWI